MASLEEAITIAVAAHSGQVDKAGQPYILHPLRVMSKFTDPVRRVVAVLHDVIEDSRDWQLSDLQASGFGDEVCEAVDALTRRDGEEYADYINRVGQNEVARDVKMADLRDNMSPERIEALAGGGNDLINRYSRALGILSKALSQEETK